MRVKRSRLPLTALRAFEAAGRHESFSRAADELAVSQAAISRQVRELETLLKRALFERGYRRVRLTDAGGRLLEQLTPSFDALSSLLSDIIDESLRRRVSISVEPSFASLWLIPRLEALAARHPSLDLQIEASNALSELRPSGPSLAIRYSLQRTFWQRSQARHLVDVELSPMMTPALAEASLANPTDLFQHPLLNDETNQAWIAWLQASGLTPTSPRWGPTFSDSAIALQSAEHGQGIALASRVIADRRIRGGQLCAPFALTIKRGAYWLLARDFSKLNDAEETFCNWLTTEMNASLHSGAAHP